MPTGCCANPPFCFLSTPWIRLACDLHGAVSVASRNRAMQVVCKPLQEGYIRLFGVISSVYSDRMHWGGGSSGRLQRAIHIITYPCTINSSFHFPHPDLTQVLLPSSFQYESAGSSHLPGAVTRPIRLPELWPDSDLILIRVPTYLFGSDSLHQHVTTSLKLASFLPHPGQSKELMLIAATCSLDNAGLWIVFVPISPR